MTVWLAPGRHVGLRARVRRVSKGSLIAIAGIFLLSFWVASPRAAQAAPEPGAGPAAAVERGPSTLPRAAFAINVVWGTEYVLPIARAFASAHRHATFFLGGEWAKAHPADARELRSMGMEIASHGDRHRHVGSLSLEENLEEIDRANTAIRDATGVRPRLYAPAYGELSPIVLQAAHLRHMPVILWTVDTIDWRTWHTPEIIRTRVLRGLVPGAIILAHPTDRTLRALPELLGEIRARGYCLVTVSDLLESAGRPSARNAGRSRPEPSRAALPPTGHSSDRGPAGRPSRTALGMTL